VLSPEVKGRNFHHVRHDEGWGCARYQESRAQWLSPGAPNPAFPSRENNFRPYSEVQPKGAAATSVREIVKGYKALILF